MSNADGRGKRCALSLLVLLLLVGTILGFTLVPWGQRMLEYRGTVNQLAQRIARYEDLVAHRADYRAQFDVFAKQQVEKGYLIDASDVDLAAAQLQKRLKTVARVNGAKLSSTQHMSAPADAENGRVTLRARITGDVDALTGVLHELESGNPLLTVENLSIRSRAKSVRKRRKAVQGPAATAGGYDLNVTMDVIGYSQGAAR